jgi:hypothetical protein
VGTVDFTVTSAYINIINKGDHKMFNSMKEIHTAIRTMTNEELDQLATAASEMYANGMINLDKMTEIMGIVVAHQLERSIKDQVVEV